MSKVDKIHLEYKTIKVHGIELPSPLCSPASYESHLTTKDKDEVNCNICIRALQRGYINVIIKGKKRKKFL